MNYLAHLYLADRTATSPAGAILGDHVRGRLAPDSRRSVQSGIVLHRRVDSFTDRHPAVLALLAAFPPRFRRYGGILVDVHFDHLLANRWAEWHDEPLPAFAERIIAATRAEWPDWAPFAGDRLVNLPQVLTGYTEPAGVARALSRVDARLRRPSPLPEAMPVLAAHTGLLAQQFDVFFPALVDYAQDWVNRQFSF
ncbi:ACP phosphodiesterase [Salinisphaera sp. P385]|uniref:ACP phosphodiesterase n=1 Tax=Spectribacter acetivorans TaxID=3075603 RepID=A0ABU3B3G6_9GAMM|nr:ACP phosphodiesterase [Salinisphaera sp. P385]MDT0617005.1 ACP phosphodiesterase [Salinisphaera sp. P385]